MHGRISGWKMCTASANPRPYRTHRDAVRKFQKDFRGKALHALTREEARRWAQRNAWRVPAVVACLNAAVEAEHIDRNPMRGMSHRGPGRRHIPPPTVEEIEALAAAAQVHGAYGPMMRALILFLAYSGARVGEAFALEWQNVDLQARRALIDKTLYGGELQLPKGGRPRRIVMTAQARDALLTIPRGGPDDQVFTGKRGGRLSQSLLTWYWTPVRARAGLGVEVVPHLLRHFAGHHFYVRLGVSDHDTAAQLGHADGGKLIRELYGHGDVGALDRIDAALENVISADFSGRVGARGRSRNG
jgi:integrase